MRDTDRKSKLLVFIQDRFFLLPALSALLLGISRYPARLNFLVFVAFIPLFSLLSPPRPFKLKQLVKTALTFSTIYTLVTLHWVSIVTLPGYLGMFIIIGLYFIILFYLIEKIFRYLPFFRYLGFISLWLSFEWLQNFSEFRFPWFNIGYSLAEYTSLIQLAEIGGIYLLSLMILLVNILLFSFLNNFPAKRSLIALIITIFVFAGWIGWGNYRLHNIHLEEEDFRGAIVQVSIPQYIKRDSAFYDSTLALYRDYTMQAAQKEPDLIIWPESAIPDYVLKINKPRRFILEVVEETGIDLFLGLPHYEISYDNEQQEFLFYNATTLINADGTIQQPYYKIYLVPFGERIPLMNHLPFLKNLDFGQANWEYGKDIVLFSVHKDDREYIFSSLICFEIAFPGLTSRMADAESDFFINVTNDAWFERTIGPYQHGMMTVIRAVETRTQIYRAANTGISLIVDPKGVILKDTQLFDKTIIDDKLYKYPGKTIFVRYLTNFPLIFLILCLSMILILLMNLAIRKMTGI